MNKVGSPNLPAHGLILICSGLLVGMIATPVQGQTRDTGEMSVLQRAQGLYNFRDFEGALTVIEESIPNLATSDPDRFELFVLKARCLALRDDREGAIQTFREVYRLDPEWEPDIDRFLPVEVSCFRDAAALEELPSHLDTDKAFGTDRFLIGATVAAGVFGLFSHSKAQQRFRDYEAANQDDQLDGAWSSYENWRQVRNVSLAVFGGLVLYQLVKRFAPSGSTQFKKPATHDITHARPELGFGSGGIEFGIKWGF